MYFLFYFPVHLTKGGARFNKKNKKNFYLTTLNRESNHVQYWTLNKFVSISEKSGFKLLQVRKSNISYVWMPYYHRLHNKALDMMDARIADILPYFMVSGWIFKLGKAVR
jgi:hypothetical protein